MNTFITFYYSDEETSSSIRGKESQTESLCASSITETDAGTARYALYPQMFMSSHINTCMMCFVL